MAEYIKREDAYKYLSRYYHHSTYVQSLYLREVLDGIPAADVVERKTGKWVDMGDFEQCSACKGTHLKEFESYYGKVMWIKTPYCPYCGAKMIGGDDDV